MTMQQNIARGRAMVERMQRNTGVLVTVQLLTYNSTKKLWEPPYATLTEHVYASIASIATIRDPRILSLVQLLNVARDKYRLITMPYTEALAEAFENDKAEPKIVREPITTSSDRYLVIEAIAPDETSGLEIMLHCTKL